MGSRYSPSIGHHCSSTENISRCLRCSLVRSKVRSPGLQLISISQVKQLRPNPIFWGSCRSYCYRFFGRRLFLYSITVFPIDLTKRFGSTAMEIVCREVRIGMDAILLYLLIGRGKESTDPTALPAGVGHEKRCRDAVARHCPGKTPWVLVDAALIPAQIASLRAGSLHEAK